MKRLITLSLLLISAATALAGSKQYYTYPAAEALKDGDKILVYQNISGSRNITGAALRRNVTLTGDTQIRAVDGGAASFASFTPSGIELSATAGASSSLSIYPTIVDISGTNGLSLNGAPITATAAELNRTVGVTSAIQGQLDAKVPKVNIQPSEITATELFRQEWATAGNAPFQLHTQSYPNPGGVGTYNHGTFIGYNVGRHSSMSATANKPSLIMGFEDNYYDDGGDNKHGMEWYVEYFSPDGTTVQMLRPFYTRILTDTNNRRAANTWFKIGDDATDSQFTVQTGYGGSNLLTITPTYTTLGLPATFLDTTEAASAVAASVILKGGLWSDKKIIGSGGLQSMAGVLASGALSYNTTLDRAGMGIMSALPTSSTGAYLGWASGISGTLAGDLLLVPRTSVAGSLRVYTGSGTPTEKLTVDATGNVSGLKFRITPEGGYAILLTAGEALNQGEIVKVGAADNTVIKNDIAGDSPIGTVYATVANGAPVWIVVNGIGPVKTEVGTSAALGQILYQGATSAGMAQAATSAPGTTQHNREVGHALTAGTSGAIVQAVLHFN